MDMRSSGILMHISSLPGDFGIGGFGKEAYNFVDFLVESGQTFWQILPLTTTSYGDSPYQSFSAIAGNTNFIDFDLLIEKQLLKKEDLVGLNFGEDPYNVDYEQIYGVRKQVLIKAVEKFKNIKANQSKFKKFENDNAFWLDDYALYMSLKEYFDNKALQEWPDKEILLREEKALKHYKKLLKDKVYFYKVCQYLFFDQWMVLKNYANKNNILIIGDIPIYVSSDSCEVWTKPELFMLDELKRPKFIAGCPPDGFSEDGQLWGNPIYNWSVHKKSNYDWWKIRIKESFKIYDYVRIDHFKGFSDYWRIDGNSTTAKNGRWVSGPGYSLFSSIKKDLGELNIIAEDLGYIDEKARKLLNKCQFPGMKVLEFGFYDTTGSSIDAPHRCTPNTVAYIGTHDNEVVNGWYKNLTDEQREYVNSYTNKKDDEPINQAMLRTLFSTSSNIAILSMQDLLNLGEETRMNTPSTLGENWQWRMDASAITKDIKDYLKKITRIYQRGNNYNE